MKLEPTQYKGIGAHILTDGNLRLLVTNYGAKIQSICYHGKEMLCQSFSQSPDYIRSQYGDTFETGEFSGFDHLFPNISQADYPDAPWANISLPDHGEVWALDWTPAFDGEALTFRVHGIRLPYHFSVQMKLEQDRLILRYEAENPSPYPMKYLWCCHPLFVLADGMELELPGCKRIINTAPGQKYLGGYLEEHNWPISNEGRNMSRLSAGNRCCNKYYVWNQRPKNTAHLHYPDGTHVTFSTESDCIPYMGVWVDELGYGKYAMRCVAPELASAALDCFEQADQHSMNSILSPGEKRDWTLEIAFQTGPN